MAVYEGARPRALGLAPRGRRIETPVMPRRRMGRAVRARRSSKPVGFLLGAIVLGFLLAFFSLVQTVRVSATGYEVDALQAEHQLLDAQRRQLLSDLNRLGREPAIRKQAIDLGLTPLGVPRIVPAQ
jgi:hypothetical protein